MSAAAIWSQFSCYHMMAENFRWEQRTTLNFGCVKNNISTAVCFAVILDRLKGIQSNQTTKEIGMQFSNTSQYQL